MTDIHIAQPAKTLAPPCEKCGQPMRIYGIEPHLRLAHTDVHTYVCDPCDATQAIVVPLPVVKT
jgi:hypothetical protein